MLRVTVGNQKGGVGKTTASTTIAAGLAARGHRVLLIDADAQGSATSLIGLRKYPGLYNLLVRWEDLLETAEGDLGRAYAQVIRMVPPEYHGGGGRLAVLGSNVETRNIAHSISDAWGLADRLDPLNDRFDFCIIDTSPTPSLLHGSIYLATDWLLYPTQCENGSIEGLVDTIGHLTSVQKARVVQIAGILPTRYRAGTLEHQYYLNLLKEQFGAKVWPEVPERIVWAEAWSARKPVFLYDPRSDAAGAAWELVDRIEELKAQVVRDGE